MSESIDNDANTGLDTCPTTSGTTESMPATKRTNQMQKQLSTAVSETLSSTLTSETIRTEGGLLRLRRFLSHPFANAVASDKSSPSRVISQLTLEGLAAHWREVGFENVITMTCADISRSAGLPDFHTPSAALDECLLKYELPSAGSLFQSQFFKSNPRPLYALVRDLGSGAFVPTVTHFFLRLLHEQRLLLRHYTQTIDSLEHVAGLPQCKVLAQHGSLLTAHCMRCRKFYSHQWLRRRLLADGVPICENCRSLIRPDIAFSDEPKPFAFLDCPRVDFAACDLLIVFGCPPQAQPFAAMIERVAPRCLRLFISRDPGEVQRRFAAEPQARPPLYGHASNTRDIACPAECDDGVMQLAQALGWDKQLRDLIKFEQSRWLREGQRLEARTPPALPCPSKSSSNKAIV